MTYGKGDRYFLFVTDALEMITERSKARQRGRYAFSPREMEPTLLAFIRKISCNIGSFTIAARNEICREMIARFDLRRTVTSLVVDTVKRERGELRQRVRAGVRRRERERERDAFRGETHGSRAVG